jgi:hypothetical protein
LPLWNRRFTVDAADPTDAHRRLEGGMSWPPSSVMWRNERWGMTLHAAVQQAPLPDCPRGYSPGVAGRDGAGGRTRGRNGVGAIPRSLPERPGVRSPDSPPAPTLPRTGEENLQGPHPSKPRNWMEGFKLRNSPPVWKVIQQETGAWEPGQGKGSAGAVGR